MSKFAQSFGEQGLAKLTIALVIFGLGAMFLGSFSYRLSNPSLVKRIGGQSPRTSDFGNQEGMNTGMTPELMSHIGELMGKLSQNPDDLAVRIELAEHFMEVNDWKSASVHLERALKINPESSTANYMLGVAWYGQGDFAASAEAFERLLGLERDPSAMFNLGILYAQHLNRQAEAKELFKEVAAMNGLDADLKAKADEALQRLQ